MEPYHIPIPEGVQKYTWRHIRFKHRDLSIDDFFFPEDFQHYCMTFGLNLPVDVLMELSKQGIKRLSDYQNLVAIPADENSLARACVCACVNLFYNNIKFNIINLKNIKKEIYKERKGVKFRKNSLFQI